MEIGSQHVGQVGSTSGGQGTDVGGQPGAQAPGLEYARTFTQAGRDPFDGIEWERRDAVIATERGEAVFEQRGVEVPRFWSQQATNIVVSKYFRGTVGHDRARVERPAAHRPRGRRRSPSGPASSGTSRARRTCRPSATT